MQYLIGEIGFSLLIAGLIGLLVGWLLSRFFKSRSAVRNRRILEKDILRRDQEIHRLRGDLDYAYGDRDTRSRQQRSSGRPEYAVSPKGMQSDSASLTVRRNEDGSYSQLSRPIAPPPGYRGPDRGRPAPRGPADKDKVSVAAKNATGRDRQQSQGRQPAAPQRPKQPGGRPQEQQNLKATIDDERHQKITALASSGEREQQLKKRLDEESFQKIQALAKLGEKERQLAGAARASTTQAAVKNTARDAGNESTINDYQKLLGQKNSQVDQLQQKVRELLALNKRPAPVAPPVPVDSGADRERERILKASVEEESFAKVQAFAALGEVERKLKQVEKRPAIDHEITPLRRRAEQQDAIILDLRKRIELQQNQSNVMRQEFDRKLKGRDSDLATMKADFTANTTNASQAEVDSYRRKLAEADRANQSRIKDFNATLEARNREYDQLGKRLEDLRQQINQKDGQLNDLKKELDQQSRERAALDAKGNKWREELGALQIAVDEKNASLGLLKKRNTELETTGTDVRDMEKQLAEFTASTEASARKFEGVILEQRKKLEGYEREIAELKKLSAQRDSEQQTQLLSLRKTVKDNESKNEALVADTNRYRSAQGAKDAEISQLGKDIKAATQKVEASRQEVKRLELIAKEAEALKAKSREQEVTRERLQQQLETALSARATAETDSKKALSVKEQEINRLSAELTSSRTLIENEKSEVVRFKKERDAEKSNIVQLTSRFESEAKKQQEKVGELEPLRLKLRDSETSHERERKEHQLLLKKSADELSQAQSKLAVLEKSGSDKLAAKDKELTDLRAKTEELHTLRGDLDQRDNKIATYDKEIEKLRAQKSEYNNEIARLSKEVDDGKAEVAQLRKSLDAEKQSLNANAKELETVRASVKERDSSITKLQTEFRASADGDKKALSDLQSRLDGASKSHQQALNEREKQIGELKHKLQEIDTLKAENSKYADQIKSLDVNLAEATKSAESSRNQISDLKKAADEARVLAAKEKESLNAELRSAKEYGAQVDGLKKQTETYQSQIQGLKADSQTNADQFHKRIKELEPWQQRFKEADQQARNHQASIVKLKADTSADLEKQLGLVRAQNSDLLAQRDKRIADLDSQVKMLDGLRREIEQKDRILADRKVEIDSAHQKAADYEKRVSAAEQQSNTLEASISKLKTEQSATGSQHQVELEQNKKQLHDLKSQLQSLEQRRATENKEHTVALDRLKVQLSEGEKKVADSARKMQEAKAQWDREVESIRTSHESKLTALDGDYRKQLDVQREKVANGTGELQSLQSKIASLEPLQGKLAAQEAENKRIEQAGHVASEKSATELTALRGRIKELEPLQKQLASSESAHQELQARMKAATDKHTADVAALHDQVKQIEPLQNRLASQEAEQKRLQESRKEAAEKVAAELGTLQARVQEIAPLERKLSAQEADYRKLQETYKASSDKSSSETASLHARIRELEPLQQKLAARDAENKRLQEAQKAAADRTSAEIATLQGRVRELEPLQQKLSAQEAEYQKLQTAQRAESDKFDGELVALQQRVRDYDSVQQNLKVQQEQYQKLQNTSKTEADKARAEVSALQAKLSEIEVLQRKLAAKDDEYDKLQSTQKSTQDKFTAEIAQLKSDIQSAEQEASKRQSVSNKELEEVRRTAESNNTDAMRKLAEANDRIQLLEPLQKETNDRQSEIARLNARLESSEAKYQKDLNELRDKLKQTDVLRAEVGNRDKELDLVNRQLADLRKDNDAQRSEVGLLKNEAGNKQSEINSLLGKVNQLPDIEKKLNEAVNSDTARSRELDALRQELKAVQDKATQANAESDRKQKSLSDQLSRAELESRRVVSLESDVKVQKATVADLNNRLSEQAAAARRLTELERELAETKQRYNNDVAGRDSRIKDLQLEIEKRNANPAPAPAPAKQKLKAQVTADGKKTTRKDGMDDLKLIFGIGPKIEEMLNKEGVRHFEDIAAWKQTDIDRYAAMLDGFPDRIERDEWVLSAQQIIDGSYNWEERRKAREAANQPAANPPKQRSTMTADGKKTTRKDGMDDLKLIFGIGPTIEKMLNKSDVKRFEDIAGWSEADVARFSEMLGSFPDRIERDEWVQSAKEIIAGTYNWTERKKARETNK